jgi:hypothetical protein
MRATCLILVLFALGGCDDDDVDLRLSVTFPDRTGTAPVPVGTDGRFRLRVSICVPHLPSARASIVSLRELGDGGPAERTLVLLEPAEQVEGCDDGTLSGTTSLPATGTTTELEVSVLGERRVVEATLADTSSGRVVLVETSPRTLPAGGGVVVITVTTDGAVDGSTVAVRTVPPLPLSTGSPIVSANRAEAVVSVPDDVGGVWIGARIGTAEEGVVVSQP